MITRIGWAVMAGLVGLWGGAARADVASPWVAGFYAGWNTGEYPPSAVDYTSLSQVMVFSLQPRANGTLDTTLFLDEVNGPRVAREVAERAHTAGKIAILVVGGEGTQSAFEGATSGPNMAAFVSNLLATAAAWGFDGIDIDWEPITSADHAPMLALVSNLRESQPGLLVTADIPWRNSNAPLGADDATFFVNLAASVNQVNMMTYAMADSWSGWVSWHSSALAGEAANHPSSVGSSARMYLAAGVPAAKLGVGIGFFGSCWNSPITGPLQTLRRSRVVAADNTMSFVNIMNSYYSGAAYRYDPLADAPYLSFGRATGAAGCMFVSYENETSVAAKARYVRQAGLGGTVIWQLAEGYNPKAADPHGLLHAVARAFSDLPPADPPPAVLAATGGTPQSTTVSTPFPQPLRATVSDGQGKPVAGVPVTFTAPPSGPGALFGQDRTVIVVTDSSGVVTSPLLTANGTQGSYTVSATAPGAWQPASFSLTNQVRRRK